MTSSWPRVILILILLVSLGLTVPFFVGGWDAFLLLKTLTWRNGLTLFMVMLLVWGLNIFRLKVLFFKQIGHLGFWQLMRIYLATEFASKTTPMGLGAPAAAVSLLAMHGIRAASCLVIFAVSSFMDAIVLAALISYFVISELAYSLGVSQMAGFYLYGGLMVLIIIGAAMLLYRHKLVFVLVVSMPGFSLTGVRGRRSARRIVVGMHRALEEVAGLPRWRLALSWGACLLYWGIYLSTLYLCIGMLGGNVPWVESGFIQTVAMGLGHIFMVPGGVGGAEIGGTLLLKPLLGAPLAATVIILWRFFMLYLYLIVGGISLLSLVPFTKAGNIRGYSRD